jgi:RNA polymerase sigma-70 factor (ECF subfamily)
VTQDALLQAHRALSRFREEAALETWFYRILVRQAHSYRRWRGLRQLWTDSSWAAEDPPDADAREGGDPALRRRIAGALEQLSRGQREVFVLVYLEGYSVREAGEILEKPTGTLKSHLHRALGKLRVQLADLRAGAEE